MRLNQIARQLNVRTETIIDYLKQQKVLLENDPNLKLSAEQVKMIRKAFGVNEPQSEASAPHKPVQSAKQVTVEEKSSPPTVKPLPDVRPAPPTTPIEQQKEAPPKPKVAKTSITVLGQIGIKKSTTPKSPTASSPHTTKRKRTRIPHYVPGPVVLPRPGASHRKPTTGRKPYGKVQRQQQRQNKQKKHFRRQQEALATGPLRVTESINAQELASLLQLPASELLAMFEGLGMHVSINQRLNREAISLIAEELKKDVEFIAITKPAKKEAEEKEEDLQPIPPIVTIMGHVDHGKTSLLDYIRKTKVTEQEAGGITQHIGAYDVEMPDGRRVVFLDTPGHKAFTAMRARGTQITNVAIIIVAADDGVMPQTKEAIGHAQLAGLPMVFAINKIDRPQANVDKVKEQLAASQILVEDWGGKYQCSEISAKTGEGVDELLEKVLLEADALGLKANPKQAAHGTIIESLLQKGRGYVATVMIQTGTLRQGDILLAGRYFGKIKRMMNAQGKAIQVAGPATPVQVLGLSGPPPAGENCSVIASEREARLQAEEYGTILKEQRLRAQHGDVMQQVEASFSEEGVAQKFAVIIKGDTGGSVEALAHMLLGLSTPELAVHIPYQGIGPISESDVLLASTTGAMIIGFQTTVTAKALKIKAQENIEIKQYKVIYEAVDGVAEAIKAITDPTEKEVAVVGKAEVRKVFEISRVGTIAGCYVKEGTIQRNRPIRLLRNEALLYQGPIKQLKREKEVIKVAKADSECGISMDGFNDVQVGDVIESLQ